MSDTDPVTTRSGPPAMPMVARWTLIAAALAGLSGAACGLVLGLAAYPPTAWFAVFEVGVPAALAGAAVGALAGSVARMRRRPVRR